MGRETSRFSNRVQLHDSDRVIEVFVSRDEFSMLVSFEARGS